MNVNTRLYCAPSEYIDSDCEAVRAFAHEVAGSIATPWERAQRLYTAVRDGIRYNPYLDYGDPGVYRASTVLSAGHGYCVGKAALYAAAARSVGIPARVGFADVRSHLATRRLLELVRTDVFAWHGYAEVWLDQGWVKVTPTFNATLCQKLGVAVLEFDGATDAILQPAAGSGGQVMEYLVHHGVFHDVPAKFLMEEIARLYPLLCDRGGDMEQEAASELPMASL